MMHQTRAETRQFNRAFEIFVVEDNAADVRLTREALKESPIPNRLSVAENGVEAMKFLRRTGKYASSPRPDIILLDLNLPLKDGREVLAEIKADPVLRRIPVLVLTTSQSGQDIVRCYDLHANSYIIKPMDIDQFIHVIRGIEDFWQGIARLSPE